MNWKKFFKYTGATLIILTIITIIWADRQGTMMYGGLTKRVDFNQFKPKTGAFVIKNVNLLSSNADRFIPNQSVYIEDGKISRIDSIKKLPANYEIVDGNGKYLIPGLIDAHVHLFKSPNDLLLYIANGVTEVRELIGEKDHLIWKKEIENGRIGPKLFVASPRLGSFGNLEGQFMEMAQGFRNIQNADQAREIVKELHDKGFDGLKIYSHLNKESYEAVAATAEELGMPIFGHIPFDVEFEDIWKNGQSGIAHFEEIMNALRREFGRYDDDEINKLFKGFDNKEEQFLAFVEQRSELLAKNLIENDISVTSTLWLTQSFVRQKVELKKVLQEVELEYENPGIAEGFQINTRALGWLPEVNRYRFVENSSEKQKADQVWFWKNYGDACQLLAKNLSKSGVKIMAGTDANLPPTVPGFSLHDELGALNDAGMSTTQVLQAATVVPADWLKSNGGKIEIGREANLVLLEKNPLLNISNTKTINTVIATGKVYDRNLLDDMLEAVKNANNESRKVDISEFELKLAKVE